MSTRGVSVEEEPEFGDREFSRIAALAKRDFGLSLSETKKPLVRSRLLKRVKACGFATFSEYIAAVEAPEAESERRALVSALTTNVTNFFREPHHFATFADTVLPACIERARSGGRVRFWSAGCSSGQEAYSLAMIVLERFPQAPEFDVRVLATDIDPHMIATAREGRYREEEWQAIPASYHGRFALREMASAIPVTMADTLKTLITFAELNLIREWPFRGPFDAIFCRNVAIYFDQDTQQKLWARFASLLSEGGHLFIGHSERVTGIAAQSMRPIGVTSYRLTSRQPSAKPERSGQWA
jgi:chemotaxis protein methyltransferase CheR